ncbi:MAG: hypothetical protein AB7O24_09845 [Kofleriaceae bacterium]
MARGSRIVLAIALAGCGDGGNTGADAAPSDTPSDGDSQTPDTLAGTGLCGNADCSQVNPDIIAYQPRFQLWSDTASKRRWMWLPPGTQIDTSNMDFWVFPVGTKFWKEFTRGSTRVETRYIVKLKADDAEIGSWFFASYAWDAAQTSTTLAPPPTGVPDANGTQHDIPSRSDCRRCHESLTPSRVLGFGAIQLDYTAADGSLDLADAVASNMLSAPPAGAAPYFALPGDTVDHDALGYLHANCGHCHNPSSPTADKTPLDLRLVTTSLGSVEATPAYMTTVNVNGMLDNLTAPIIIPDDPASSVMIIRMNAAEYPPKMPELATEMVDPTGQIALTAWINSL